MKKALYTAIILSLALQSAFPQEKGLEVGDLVKDFKALDDQGKKWSSADLEDGKYLVVYFYPAAMTGGCTKQACAYRDDMSTLEDLNAEIIGVSGDEVKNLEFFKKAHDLNFTLLSDPRGKIAALFGVPVNLTEKSIIRNIDGVDQTLTRQATTSRWTFIIDGKGKVIYKSSDVKAAEDSKVVIDILKNS